MLYPIVFMLLQLLISCGNQTDNRSVKQGADPVPVASFRSNEDLDKLCSTQRRIGNPTIASHATDHGHLKNEPSAASFYMQDYDSPPRGVSLKQYQFITWWFNNEGGTCIKEAPTHDCPPGLLGFYTPRHEVISICVQNTARASPAETMKTIAHEAVHRMQHCRRRSAYQSAEEFDKFFAKLSRQEQMHIKSKYPSDQWEKELEARLWANYIYPSSDPNAASNFMYGWLIHQVSVACGGDLARKCPEFQDWEDRTCIYTREMD